MQKTIETASAIFDCVMKYQHGFKNEDALQEITHLVNQIKFAVPAAAYEADRVLEWAQILYSAKKHERYPGGADEVRQSLLGYCDSLLKALRHIAITAGEKG